MIKLFNLHLNSDIARVYIDDALDRGALTNSPAGGNGYVEQLGEVVAGLMGFKYGIPCSSGTTAAEVLISAMLDYYSDPVINMPYYNYGGLTNMVVDNMAKWGARVNLTSSDPGDYSAQFDYVSYKDENTLWINSYLYGNPGDYDNREMCIGDLSHLTGADCSGLNLEYAFTSLYPTKNIGAGEGGVVLTNDFILAKKVKDMIAAQSDLNKSYNRRMSEIHAGIGLANAMGVKERLTHRNRIYSLLRGLIDEDCRPPAMDKPYMFIILNLSASKFDLANFITC